MVYRMKILGTIVGVGARQVKCYENYVWEACVKLPVRVSSRVKTERCVAGRVWEKRWLCASEGFEKIWTCWEYGRGVSDGECMQVTKGRWKKFDSKWSILIQARPGCSPFTNKNKPHLYDALASVGVTLRDQKICCMQMLNVSVRCIN